MSRRTRTPSKFNDCLTGDELDFVMNEGSTETGAPPDLTDNIELEVPIFHAQSDGKTNNVTFKTNRIEQWKESIVSFFL